MFSLGVVQSQMSSGADVTPNPVFWTDIYGFDFPVGEWVYTYTNISGINTAITLRLSFSWTGTPGSLYYKITNTEPTLWTNGSTAYDDPVTLGFTAFSTTTDIIVNPNQFVSFGVTNGGNTGTLTVTNVTGSNTVLQVINLLG